MGYCTLQIAVQALFLSYQMFIWPIADRFHQGLELFTLATQLLLLVSFTSMMDGTSESQTLESVIVGAFPYVHLSCGLCACSTPGSA